MGKVSFVFILLSLIITGCQSGDNQPAALCSTGTVEYKNTFLYEPIVNSSAENVAQNSFHVLNVTNWPARWNCGNWAPIYGWTYIVSDIAIWLAYFAIPALLGVFYYRKRKEIPFKLVFLLFIGFIVFCGLTHLLDAIIFWWPAYNLATLLKLGTAVISCSTVFALIKVIPSAMELKSPEYLKAKVLEKTEELEKANLQLREEMIKRKQAEKELRTLNSSLEAEITSQTTALKDVNRDLLLAQEMFESVQNAAEIGIWEVDLSSGDLFWSDKVYEIHELEIGTPIMIEEGINFYHPDYRSTIETAVDSAIKEGKGWNLELILITDKGNEVWVNAIGIPLREGEKTVKLRGLFQDINEKKKLTIKNKIAQKRLELFVEHTPAAVAMFDTDMQYLMASRRWYEDYGLVNEKIIGRSHYEIFPEILEMPKWLDDHKRALNGEVIKYDNDRFEREDGSVQWLKYEIYPWHDLDGSIGGIGMFTEDITEEKELTESLKREELKFRSMIESSPIGVATVSTEGLFLSVNKALSKILGYSQEQLIDLTFQEITHPDDLETDLNKVNQILNLEISSYMMEKRYFHKKGHIIWVQLNVSAAFNADGQVNFFISQIQDITERKKNSEILEKRVKQRTKQLEAVNEELKAFSYSISHDLRSPLRSIQGFSQAIFEDENDKLDSNSQNYLQRIMNAANRMSELIDDVLSLSRLTRLTLTRTEVDLSAMCKDIIEIANADDRYHIEIEKDLIANGDEKLMRIALENLIGNAIKYSSKVDQPKVKIGMSELPEGQFFYIEDNGAGFDMDYADKLFGAFQRLHRKDEFEGSGIGLATVKRIINKHNGDIWVKSAVNKGTTFFFSFGEGVSNN